MRPMLLTITIVAACLLLFDATPARAAAPRPANDTRGMGAMPSAATSCMEGTQASGAQYRICVPAAWNGDLVVYAHGYMAPTRPIGLPQDQLVLSDGTPVDQAITALGYAFAASSYSTNGLAVLQGVDDNIDLINIFKTKNGIPKRVIIVGVSEGGLIAVLAVEQHPSIFNGGMALCGPYGNFQQQVDYFADFRVLFDYFFPGLMPPTPVDIPPSLMSTWDTGTYSNTIRPHLVDPANQAAVDQLLAVSGAAYDSANSASKEETIRQVLWYNVFSTNDGKSKLGGQPYDNTSRQYTGSNDDQRLNDSVQRFMADPAARQAIADHYQTTGKLSVPLTVLHTDGDPVVPVWHADEYQAKVIAQGTTKFYQQQIIHRSGHCTFTPLEIIAAFNGLLQRINTQETRVVFLPMVAN